MITPNEQEVRFRSLVRSLLSDVDSEKTVIKIEDIIGTGLSGTT